MLVYRRDVCGDPARTAEYEWLVTNGLGGYAGGTIAGIHTRRYHGLLLAALQPPVGRWLLVSRFDETAHYDGAESPLYANQWGDGTFDAPGCAYLEQFHLEGTSPVWAYALADALLEKRVWMRQGANTTYIQYTLVRGRLPLLLTVKALINYRDHHSTTAPGSFTPQIAPLEQGLRVTAFDGAAPIYLRSDRADAVPQGEWYGGYYLAVEQEQRGFKDHDANYYAGQFSVTLRVGESVTFVASTEADASVDGTAAWAAQRTYEGEIVGGAQRALSTPPAAARPNTWRGSNTLIQQLFLAADQFIVRRALPSGEQGYSVIAGFPWFGDWGRDTMIALPGLTLTTGRPEIARDILRTFSHFVDQGMLPNRFPDSGEAPEYNTVDATLWYFEAIRAYHAATGDDDLLRELFPILREIIEWHVRGTRYRIQVDPADGLLRAGEPGVQLTWMDAKYGDWVVTPRIGKPVEINALWYNALRGMSDFAARLGEPANGYRDLADKVERSFHRFWNAERGYCYDVLDEDDPTLRPNQVIAAALHYSPMTPDEQRAVVDVCARKLWTSHGLRSLSPDDPQYAGRYIGEFRYRDGIYHQGTGWSWLAGAFISAHLRVYGDVAAARSYLDSILGHVAGACIGSISEIFDGDAPFTPRGAYAQAWGVAEVLRVWAEIESAQGQ